MAAAGDFVKVKTCIFRVKMHCDGCKKKVKKILRKNEGVYIVDIDSEPEKATIIGNFDPDTLLKQLKKKHKYVEFWDSPTSDVVDSPSNTSNELSNGQGKNNSSKKKKGKNNAGGTSQVATTPQPQSSKTMLKKDQDKKSSKSNKPNGANLTLGDDEVESEDGEDDDEDSSLIKKNSVSNKSEHGANAGLSKKNKAKNSKNQQQKVGPKMKNQQPKKTGENIEGFQPMVHGYNEDSATYHPYPYTPMNGHYATYVEQDEGFPACTVM